MNGTPKPGEWWRLADSSKAVIYAVNVGVSHRIHGAYEDTGELYVTSWGEDGDNGALHARDLISRIDWRDELAPIWRVLKPEWRWIAQDADGDWWAYARKPKATRSHWSASTSCELLSVLAMPTPDCQWDETLTERPEGV